MNASRTPEIHIQTLRYIASAFQGGSFGDLTAFAFECDMWASHLWGPCVMHSKACAVRH